VVALGQGQDRLIQPAIASGQELSTMNARIQQFGARRLATVILALGLVGVVAVPVINAASSGPAPAAPSLDSSVGSSAGGAAAGQVDEAAINAAQLRLGGKLLNRVVRGDFVVRAKSGTFVDVHYERGQISAVTATSLTVVGPDGKGATFSLTSATRIRADGQLAKSSDLQVGRTVLVFGTGSSGSYTAIVVRQPRVGAAGGAAPSASTKP
jgi:hypothetical protein